MLAQPGMVWRALDGEVERQFETHLRRRAAQALEVFQRAQLRMDGIVIGNTTLSRPPSLLSRRREEAGGLSGGPLTSLATEVLRKTARRVEGQFPLIGCGGVGSGADAYAKIRAGASLVQLYSAMVYDGPPLVRRIKNELAALLARDGFRSVGDAVGVDV